MFRQVDKYMQRWRESFLRDGTRPTKPRHDPVSILDSVERPVDEAPVYMDVSPDQAYGHDGWSLEPDGANGFIYLPLVELREEFEAGDRYQKYAARMLDVFHSRFLTHPESHGADNPLDEALRLHQNSANYRRAMVTGGDGVALRQAYSEFKRSGSVLGFGGLMHPVPGSAIFRLKFIYAGNPGPAYARKRFEEYYFDRGPRGAAYDLYKRSVSKLRMLDIVYAKIKHEDEEEQTRLQAEFVARHPHYEPAPYDRMAARNNPYKAG